MKRLGIDIGSTTVKVAVIDEQHNILFSDYQRHFAKIQETLSSLLKKAKDQIGEMTFAPTVTGSGGLSISSYLDIPFCQEVVCVSSALQDYAPQTDVAIELGGEDAKIIYFTNGIDQRMNGVCAGGTGSFIDQMASLLQTDAGGLNEYAKDYDTIYPIAARCGVFAKTDIQPLITKVLQNQTLLPLFSRLLSTRQSPVSPAVNRSVVMWPFSAVRCISSPSCAKHLSAP